MNPRMRGTIASALTLLLGTVAITEAHAEAANTLRPVSAQQQGNSVVVGGTSARIPAGPASKSQYVDPGYRPPYPYDASPSHPNFTQWQNAIAACPENEQIMNCLAQFNDLLKPISGGTYRPPTRNQIEGAARQAILRMNLPLPTPHIGPDPTTNEWNMAVVGYPLWLWTNGPTTLNATSRDYGIPLSLHATLHHTTFDMGDGHTLTCTTTDPYPTTTKPATPAPHCGYTYQKASLPKTTYQVTATAHWTVHWSAMSHTGTLTATVDDTTPLPVGELQTIVTR